MSFPVLIRKKKTSNDNKRTQKLVFLSTYIRVFPTILKYFDIHLNDFFYTDTKFRKKKNT